jgi:hypothetical protein
LAKRGSVSEPHPLRAAGWAALLLLLAPGLLAARPVTAEFTDANTDARSFQPLRLSVDVGGRERQMQLILVLPPGGRIEPAVPTMTAGGRIHVRILNVYVPGGTAAGAFTVRGTVIDGSNHWPFEAVIGVRANPRLLVRDLDIGFATVDAAATVRRTWRVTNSGNVVLTIHPSAQPSTGAVLTVEPEAFTLGPGEHREIVLTARLESTPDRLITVPLFLNVDSAEGNFRRRETVVFTAEFVPRTAGTGPLFAELTGEVLVGGVASRDQRGLAGRLRVEGEVLPGFQLLAYGVDGTPAPGGSQLGLAERDFLTVELASAVWRATGGLVDPPSFGFLETSTQGRGGTLARSNGTGLTLTALATQEHYEDFSREHVGLHLAQVNPDHTGWEAGVLAQRNQSGADPEQERMGAYVQTDWQWRNVTGSSQVAAAHNRDSPGLSLGLEQRLDYQAENNGTTAALFAQTAPAGFFLDGRSTELRDASLGLAVGETGRLDLHWSESREQGLLRTYNQTETDAGLTPTDPAFVELITRTGSAVRSWSAGYAFSVQDGRSRVAYSDSDRTRDTGGTAPGESYRERAITADWSKSINHGRLFVTATLSGGTEENLGQPADFAESAFTAGGNVGGHLELSAELRHTWHTGGTENAGYRQPGTYGRGSLVWTPHPRYHLEAGVDGYQFSNSSGRVRSYVVLEVPVTSRVALATEISHDNERTSFWLVARVSFKAQMRWRPVRGALTGLVRDDGSGAPVNGARLALGGQAGLTSEDGRFTLPGRLPGAYPLTWGLPAGYLAAQDWPHTVNIRAGELQHVELRAERLGLLNGSIAIDRDGEIERPTGAVSATDDAGAIFETMAAAGEFNLRLPPGRYTVRYTGELAAEVAAQLVAVVMVGEKADVVAVQLTAREKARGMRRTLFEDNPEPPKSPGKP